MVRWDEVGDRVDSRDWMSETEARRGRSGHG